MQFRLFGRRGWLAVSCATLVGGGLFGDPDPAFGQLRTGRSDAREFYSVGRTESSPRQVGSGIPSNEKVVQASCRSCVQGAAIEDGSAVIEDSHGSEIVVEDENVLHDHALGHSHGAGHSHGVGHSYGACGVCGDHDGNCGCDGIPHINIRLALPFAKALDRFSVRMEAATFWRDHPTIPALVRTDNIGTVGSRDLFGGTIGMDETTQGYRGEVAWRLGHDACTSVQVRFFDAGAQSLTFDSTATGSASIVRPYFDGVNQNSIVVQQPNLATGTAFAHATSDLFGGDLLLKQSAYRSRYSKLDLLVGYQTASLSDRLWVNSTTQAPVGTFLDLRDRFDTDNRFHGGVIGFSGIAYAPRWSLSSMFKLGMGNMNRSVGIDGSQSITTGSPAVTTSSSQGLQARATNIGNYQFDTFIVSPEANLTLGYRLTRRLEATVGYDYLLLPKVARAADQFDPALAANLSNPLTGDPRPRFTFKERDLGIHSLSYGLQYRY
ncbi:MAG: BBP7 family outer membrane beta-barrel protein [Planctomycetota bacterium]